MTGSLVTGTDDATEGRWLTYDELAQVRGIQRIGAVRLAKRQGWRRQPGNDGKARVMVPTTALSLVRGTRPSPSAIEPVPDGVPDGEGNSWANGGANGAVTTITALQGAIDTLRQQLVRADAREDALRAALDQASAEAKEAREATEALRQAEEARKARGRWARLRAAWRGE
jgi:hypothetical protein